jgi:hypothetical protein
MRPETKRVAMGYKPRRIICAFCGYRLSASALKFLLGPQCH